MKFDQTTTVLMVMDFMNDIVHPKGKFAPWGIPAHVQKQNAIANTKNLLQKARKARIKVIHITVSYEKGYASLKNIKTSLHKSLQEAGALLRGEWGAEIYEELRPITDEVVLNKTRTNPFTIPELEEELNGKVNVLLAGVATNFVVEECARTAAAKDFNVVVIEDCCASMSQEIHDFPIKNILPHLTTVMKSKEVDF